MNWRDRRAFWAFTAAVLALVSVPSADLVSSLAEYGRFAAAWEPAPLKPVVVGFVPHASRPSLEEELKPVEFRHQAPRARSVELVGDFNAWKPGVLRMSRGEDGAWTAVVPVPKGRRRYLFLVDGEPRLDAKADAADGPQGRRVSARTVR